MVKQKYWRIKLWRVGYQPPNPPLFSTTKILCYMYGMPTRQADVSLNEDTADDGDEDTSPMDSSTSSLSPFERVLNVADFTRHFKRIGKVMCINNLLKIMRYKIMYKFLRDIKFCDSKISTPFVSLVTYILFLQMFNQTFV